MICIASSGVLGSNLESFPPISIWARCLVSSVVLGLYCKIKAFSFQLKKGKSRLTIFVSGILMTLHWVSYFFALNYTSVAIAMMAIFTFPMMTTLMEPLFFDIKIKQRSIILSLFLLIGMFYLLPELDPANSDTIGLICGLLSAFFYSLRNIFLKKEIESYNGSVLMFYQSTIAVIILIPVFFFVQPSTDIILHDLPFLLGLGLITTCIGHTIFLNSFKHFKISTASIMGGLQPIYGIVLAMIFLHEIPSLRSGIGGFIIIICVLSETILSLKDRDKEMASKLDGKIN